MMQSLPRFQLDVSDESKGQSIYFTGEMVCAFHIKSASYPA